MADLADTAPERSLDGEAALWIVLLQEYEIDDLLVRAWAEWSADPAHIEAYDALLVTYDVMKSQRARPRLLRAPGGTLTDIGFGHRMDSDTHSGTGTRHRKPSLADDIAEFLAKFGPTTQTYQIFRRLLSEGYGLAGSDVPG